MNLDEVNAIASCIKVSVPLLHQTRHLINEETKMKYGVWNVTTATGKVVDELLIEGSKSSKI